MTVAMGYAEAGDGPTVVALHGGIVSGRLTFGPVLSSWARRLRVLVPDRRGFERTPAAAPGTITEQAEDLLAFIAAHGRAGPGARGRAHVVGASIGGVVALTALQLDPDAFRSLTLLEAPALSLTPGEPDARAWREELEDLHEQFTAQGPPAARDLLAAFLARTDPGSAKPLLRLLEAGDPGVSPHLGDLLPWETPLTPEGVRRADVPVLVCSGERSWPRLRHLSERVASVLGAEHRVIPGAGHALALAGRRLLDPLRTHIAHAEALSNRSPTTLATPDPAWPERFAAEAAVLRAELGALAQDIEHVGSTAVAGVAAKPVIDLMVGVRDLAADAATVCPRIEGLGYSWWRSNPRADTHAFLLRACDGVRTHHVHVTTRGSRFWRERVAFRDALRADADLAASYERMKRDLSARFPLDREAYTQGKSRFVADVLGKTSPTNS